MVQLPQGNWTQKMNQAVVDLSPCFSGVKRLRGALGLARPAALRSAGLHVGPEPSSVSQGVYADAETGSQTGPH